MTGLTLMRGYPGSGKTTASKEFVYQADTTDPTDLRARVSRDDYREDTFVVDTVDGRLSYAQEQHLTDLIQDAVRKLLKRGYDVVVDDLNLRRRYCVDWAAIALEQQVDFGFYDVPTDTDQCIKRDAQRARGGGRHVGEEAIRKVAQKFPVSRWDSAESILESAREKQQIVAGNWVPYDNPKGLPRIVLVDLDGTVALKDRAPGSRGWHEYHRVGEDLPNPPVIEMVRLLHEATDAEVVFMSGRKDYCREETRKWLYKHVGHWTYNSFLFMRSDDDNREDSIVKHELFDAHIRGKAHVVGAFDDRDRVVAMWRAIGLQVYQVAPGNF